MKKCNNPNCNCVDCPNGFVHPSPWTEWPGYPAVPNPIQPAQQCNYCSVLLMVIPPGGFTCPACGKHIMGGSATF